MALGLSSPSTDLTAVVESDEGEAGIPGGSEIRRFARGAIARATDLGGMRAELVAVLGTDGVVDAAAVGAFFDAINRVADATGTVVDDSVRDDIPLDLSWMHSD